MKNTFKITKNKLSTDNLTFKRTLFIFFVSLIMFDIKSQIIYSGTQTVTSRSFNQNVIIDKKAKITFTGNFQFAPGTTLFVDEDAFLKLDNAHLNAQNPSNKWKGITMQTLKEFGCSCGTMGVYIINSSVKNALVGITNVDANYMPGVELLGGMVHIENSVFDNYFNAILYNEECVCQINGAIINNTFYTEAQPSFGHLVAPSTSIMLFNNPKNIKNNTFINKSGNMNTGCFIENYAGFIESNSFQGFSTDLDIKDISFVYQTTPKTRGFDFYIRNNQLGATNQSLILSGFDYNKYVNVLNNVISGTTEINNYTMGSFSNNQTNNSVLINDIGTDGIKFEGNMFNGYEGVSVRGVLRGNNSGQTFVCNTFFTPTQDITLQSGSEIAFDQGWGIPGQELCFYNRFSPNTNFYNNGSQFKYFVEGPLAPSNPYNPENLTGSTQVFRFNFNTSTAPNLCTTNKLKIAINNSNTLGVDKKELFLDKYDKVLLSLDKIRAAYKTPCIGEWTLSKDKTLVDVQWNDIKILKNYLFEEMDIIKNWNASNSLFDKKGLYLQTYTGLKNELVQYQEQSLYTKALYNEPIAPEELNELKDYQSAIGYEKIADIHLIKKQYSQALAVYSQIKTEFALSAKELNHYNKMSSLVTVLKGAFESDRLINQFNTTEIIRLKELAQDKSYRAGRIACRLLDINKQFCSPLAESNTIALQEFNGSVALYPNPATQYVTIKTLESIDNIKVYNTQGNITHSIPATASGIENTLDISLWQNGFYYIKATNTQGNVSTLLFQKQ